MIIDKFQDSDVEFHIERMDQPSADQLTALTKVRRAVFKRTWPDLPYPDTATVTDLSGTHHVCWSGERIACAVRFNVRNQEPNGMLPSETSDMRLEDVFGLRPESTLGIGEIGGLFRTTRCTELAMTRLYDSFVTFFDERGLRAAYCTAPPDMLAVYEHTFARLGWVSTVRACPADSLLARKYGYAPALILLIRQGDAETRNAFGASKHFMTSASGVGDDRQSLERVALPLKRLRRLRRTSFHPSATPLTSLADRAPRQNKRKGHVR